MIKFSFRTKLILVFIVIALGISSVTTYLIYRRAIEAQFEELRNQLLVTAKLGAQLIDGDVHSKIKLERASVNTPEYQEIKKSVQKILESNPRVRYVYTMVKFFSRKQGTLRYVLNSAKIEKFFVYPGDAYNAAHFKEIWEAFNRPTVDKKIKQDEFGTFLSGYAPIRNSEGDVVAILGVDMEASTIAETQNILKRRMVQVAALSLILCIVLGIIGGGSIARPVRQLLEGTKRIAGGDLDFKVKIKTHDELRTLAESFNQMSESLKSSYDKLQRSFINTVKSLVAALEAKDPYTRGHSDRVVEFCIQIGKEMNLSEREIEMLRRLSSLHDIGKIGIKEEILRKPTKLTDEEFEYIKKHTIIGETILDPISLFDEDFKQMIRSHHERPDGKGYPDGLHKEQISKVAAIVSVADSFDAMTSDRPYRKALTTEKAAKELIEHAGTQFDKDVVDAFIHILKRRKLIPQNL